MGEELAHPGSKLLVGETGVTGAQAAGLELPGERQELVGDFQFALGTHGAEAPGLQHTDHRIDGFHDFNVGIASLRDKTARRRSARQDLSPTDDTDFADFESVPS